MIFISAIIIYLLISNPFYLTKTDHPGMGRRSFFVLVSMRPLAVKKKKYYVFKQWSKRQNNGKVSQTSRVISIANWHIVMTNAILAPLQEVPTLHQKLAEVELRFIPHSWCENLVEKKKRKKAWDVNAGHSNIGTFSLNAQCCKRVAKTHIYLLCFLRRNWANWRAKRLILGGFQFWVLVIA